MDMVWAHLSEEKELKVSRAIRKLWDIARNVVSALEIIIVRGTFESGHVITDEDVLADKWKTASRNGPICNIKISGKQQLTGGERGH